MRERITVYAESTTQSYTLSHRREIMMSLQLSHESTTILAVVLHLVICTLAVRRCLPTRDKQVRML